MERPTQGCDDTKAPGTTTQSLSTTAVAAKPANADVGIGVEPTGEALRRLSDWLGAGLASSLAKSLGEEVRRILAEDSKKRSAELQQLRVEMSRMTRRAKNRVSGARANDSSSSSDSLSEEEDDPGANSEMPSKATQSQTQREPASGSGGAASGRREQKAGFLPPVLEHQGNTTSSTLRNSAPCDLQKAPSAAANSRTAASQARSIGAGVSTCPALPQMDLGSLKAPTSSSAWGSRAPGALGGASAWAKASPQGGRAQKNDLMSLEQRLTNEIFKARELVVRNDVYRPLSVAAEDAPAKPTKVGTPGPRQLDPVVPAQSQPQKPTPIQAMLAHPQLPQLAAAQPMPVLQQNPPRASPHAASSSAAPGMSQHVAPPLPAVPTQARSPGSDPPSSRHSTAEINLRDLHLQPRASSPPASCASSSSGADLKNNEEASPRDYDSDAPCRTGMQKNCDLMSESAVSVSSFATNAKRPQSCRMVPSMSQQRCTELAKVLDRERAQHVMSEHESASPYTQEAPQGCVKAALWKAASISIHVVPRVCGVVAWRIRFRWSSWVYQVFVFTLGLGSCGWLSSQLISTTLSSEEGPPQAYECIDFVIALGGLLSLFAFGGLWQNQGVSSCVELLTEYARREGFLPQCQVLTCLDLACTFALWIVTAGARIWGSTNDDRALDLVAFVVMTGMTAGVATQILILCRAMAKMVDTFCYNVVEQPEFGVAMQEWTLIQAFCRTSCANVQWPFVVLQITGTLVSLLIIAELRDGLARAGALLPGMFVCISIVRVGFWAAAVTDKCARVPMLVNAINVEGELVKERMFVVDYIVHSRVGFYVFEVCLSTSTMLKALYVSGAIAFGLASQARG